MMHVNFDTAKRLFEAGFPQPLPQRGQVWFLKGGLPLVVIAKSDAVDLKRCDYVTAGGTLFINRYMSDGEVFAPTATEILRDLPGWNLSRNMSGWQCWMEFTDKHGYDTKIFNYKNPAEAAAQAWLQH